MSDRMGPLDSAFWALENEHASVHIASVAVFDGTAPTAAELRGVYRRALHRIPRLHERMRRVPFGLGRPVWVDDPEVDLGYHLRRTALPAPGSAAELDALVGRLMTAHLDPERPLWEVWLVEGLADDRWALITKLHHSMLDGVSGMGVLAGVLDASPDSPVGHSARWVPRSAPGRLRLVASAVRAQAEATAGWGLAVASVGRHPALAARTTAHLARGLSGYAAAAVRPAGSRVLNGPLHAPRAYVTADADLAEVRAVRSALGGSVNDVVLAMATGGLRELLVRRGEQPLRRAVRALVPVSIRIPGDTTVDNQVSALLAELPVECADTTDRYLAVQARTRRLKASHEAEAGAVLTAAAQLLPAPLLSAGLRVAARAPQRVLSTVVTNVPGPPRALYLLGRRMVAHYPFVPIADRLRIGIAVTSYDGRLYFGITADRDSVPDLGVVAAGIEQELADLLKSVDERS